MSGAAKLPSVPRALLLATVAYAIVYFVLDVNRFAVYDTGLDFFLFAQAVSDRTGLLRTGLAGSLFHDHFSPIYDIAMPFVVASGSPLPLIAFQAAAGALVAVGLFRVARRIVPAALATRVALLALLYPPLAGVIFGDPNETCFAPAATVWLFAFVLERRWIAAAIVAVLALAIKEDQAILLIWNAAIAVVAATRSGDLALRRFAYAVAAIAGSVLATYVLVIQPSFSTHATWGALALALRAAPSDPTGGWSISGRLGYIAEILVPLAFLPILGWRALVFAVPALTEVLLSRNSAVWSMGQHYAGVWIGYVLVAAAYGAYVAYAKSPKLASRIVTVAMLLCVLDLAFASPTHWRKHVRFPSAHDRARDALLATAIPKGATVGTQDELLGHLWNDVGARYGVESSPQYALVDTSVHGSYVVDTMLHDIATSKDGTYDLVWTRDAVALYRRRSP